MFSFFRKKNILMEVDIHSHLIPNIDDGAKDMEEAIMLIKELSSLGYKKLITTPHINDLFQNKKNDIITRYLILKNELIKRKIQIKLELGAEYYIDDFFRELLGKERLLSFGDKNYLLFEFSYFTEPRDIENLIYDIILEGYTPLLAHPERYIYWHNNFNQYQKLKEMGVFFQLNLNSIGGFYNKDIRNIAEKLIKNSYIDFIGSDTHHLKHIKHLKKSLSLSFYQKIFKYNTILNDTLMYNSIHKK